MPVTAQEAVREIVCRIAERRPGRSEATLAADIRGLLLSGYLDLEPDDLNEIELEAAAGGGRRIDVEVGYTVIEVKKDLRAGDTRARAIQQLAVALAAIGNIAEHVRPFAELTDDLLPGHDELGRLYVIVAKARFDVREMQSMLDDIDEAMNRISYGLRA